MKHRSEPLQWQEIDEASAGEGVDLPFRDLLRQADAKGLLEPHVEDEVNHGG